MKKTVFTLCVDDYAPEIRDITYPLLKKYANKIGADFCVIDQRKYPDMPVTYEKIQVRDKAEGNDWNLFFDSDVVIHPDTPDITTLMPRDTVGNNRNDFASMRWTYDKYFIRDGRNIGCGNWLILASDLTVDDLFAPLDIPLEEALKNIHPTTKEEEFGITKEHLIDDYLLSRNVARYGLKYKPVDKLLKEYIPGAKCFYHIYTDTIEEKVKKLKSVVERLQ